MTDSGWLIALAILVVVGIPAMVAMILYSQIKAFGRPDLELVPADRKRHGKAISDSQTHDAWFVAQGFDIVGTRPDDPLLAAAGTLLVRGAPQTVVEQDRSATGGGRSLSTPQ